MTSLLLFLGNPKRVQTEELSKIASLGHKLTVVSAVEELETTLRSQAFDALIWLFDPATRNEMLACLERSRNFSQARLLSVLILARSEPVTPTEDFLHQGVLGVFRHSDRDETWLKTLQEIIGTQSRPVSFQNLTRTKPTKVVVEHLCRIGKLSMSHPPQISIEANLVVAPQDKLVLKGPLADSIAELGVADPLTLRVLASEAKDLYYRYHNRLEATLDAPPSPSHWSEWILGNKSHWVAPKTKLLWVTNQYTLKKEGFFDKTLFSIYAARPLELNRESLDRIDPKIVLVDSLDGDTDSVVSTWARGKEQESTCLVFNGLQGPTHWNSTVCFDSAGISQSLNILLREFLRKRILHAASDSKYLSRKSAFSRAALQFVATLNEISSSRFALISSVDVYPGGVLRLVFEAATDSARITAFGKVIKSEFLADLKTYRLLCEWQPVSDLLEENLPQYKSLILT